MVLQSRRICLLRKRFRILIRIVKTGERLCFFISIFIIKWIRPRFPICSIEIIKWIRLPVF